MDMKDFLAILRSFMTGSRETADRICRNEFEFLGVSIKFGKYIDWTYGVNRDRKLPWELSRFQFLPSLCRAYELHHNDQYALHSKELIRDWIIKNPLEKGVNWTVTMEVAIRSCNIALAFFFLHESHPWHDQHFKKLVLESLANHGKFIESHLEYGRGFNTNHLIADFTGLFWIATLFPDFPDAKRWKNIAIQGLEQEMKHQVYRDGVDYEASISYHRLVTEFFGMSALLGKYSDVKFSNTFLQRLEKMFEFAWYYTKPNGLAPQIGDNDDGRFFIFEDFYTWEPRDHKHLFWLAERLFSPNKKFIQKHSRAFQQGNVYIMQKDDFYCLVDCGSNGQNGNGGHAHNDTLSFELSVSGEDFMIDPGTYVYTADRGERRRFRGTRMHNTVMIDEKEMNRFRFLRLFGIKNDAIPHVNKWQSTETHDFLDAQHSGYERLSPPVTHRRTFLFDKNNMSLEITDYFLGKGTHTFEWNFHFSPGVTVAFNSNIMMAEKNGEKINMEIPHALVKSAQIIDGEVSPRYGVKEKALVLKISKEISLHPNHENPFRFSILSA